MIKVIFLYANCNDFKKFRISRKFILIFTNIFLKEKNAFIREMY